MSGSLFAATCSLYQRHKVSCEVCDRHKAIAFLGVLKDCA